jgi:glucans biosynthesis protein C
MLALQHRRTDLDWLRVIAFGLLIFYHIGMLYVTWDWHVKSRFAGPDIEPLMQLLNPWRLSLLFFIAGIAIAHSTGRYGLRASAKERWQRLFWPILFGMLVVVPPQSYAEIGEKLSYAGRYWQDFYPLYLTGYDGWCRGDDCLAVPTWNHLWFVVYLLAYALLLIFGLAIVRRFMPALANVQVPLALFVLGPWLWWWAIRVTLLPHYEITHALFDDVYGHALYAPIFLLGFIAAFRADFVAFTVRWRWQAAAIAAVAYALRLYLNSLPDPTLEAIAPLARGVQPLQAWATILALLGFARQHLRDRDGPVLRWLSRAVFPCYIAHQTLIILIGPRLEQTSLPLGVQVTLLIVGTAAGSLIVAWLAMRIPGLGWVLGTAKASPKRQPAPA